MQTFIFEINSTMSITISAKNITTAEFKLKQLIKSNNIYKLIN